MRDIRCIGRWRAVMMKTPSIIKRGEFAFHLAPYRPYKYLHRWPSIRVYRDCAHHIIKAVLRNDPRVEKLTKILTKLHRWRWTFFYLFAIWLRDTTREDNKYWVVSSSSCTALEVRSTEKSTLIIFQVKEKCKDNSWLLFRQLEKEENYEISSRQHFNNKLTNYVYCIIEN